MAEWGSNKCTESFASIGETLALTSRDVRYIIWQSEDQTKPDKSKGRTESLSSIDENLALFIGRSWQKHLDWLSSTQVLRNSVFLRMKIWQLWWWCDKPQDAKNEWLQGSPHLNIPVIQNTMIANRATNGSFITWMIGETATAQQVSQTDRGFIGKSQWNGLDHKSCATSHAPMWGRCKYCILSAIRSIKSGTTLAPPEQHALSSPSSVTTWHEGRLGKKASTKEMKGVWPSIPALIQLVTF